MRSEKKDKELFDPALGNCQTYDSCRNGGFCQAASVVPQLPPDHQHPCTHPQLLVAVQSLKEKSGGSSSS